MLVRSQDRFAQGKLVEYDSPDRVAIGRDICTIVIKATILKSLQDRPVFSLADNWTGVMLLL